ncbi:MAG TPA: hypothetical protein VKV19_02975 [Ktedonobacteraceae bacterium]|nr:hypothetical protein [Ktedonobacteraceae bacterium]
MNNYPASNPYSPTQPVYPAQPGGSSAAPPAPERRRGGLWAAIIIVLLLLIIGGGAYYFLALRPTPQKTLQSFCDAVTKGNGLNLYNLYSSSLRAQASEQTVQRELELIIDATGGFKSCTVDGNSIQQSGSVATGTVILVSNRGHTFNDAVDLVQENGQWKVEHPFTIPANSQPKF